MLLERTDDLLQSLDIYEKSKALASKKTDLNQRFKTATEIHNVLIRVNARNTFFIQEIRESDLRDVFTGLNNALQSLKSKLNEDSTNILEPHNFWRSNATKLESDAEKVFLLDWDAYIKDNLQFTDKKELEMWSQVPELTSSAKRLKEFVEGVEELKKKLPDIEQVMLIKKMSADMHKFFDDLKKAGVPEDVRDFLDKATSIGISLVDINEQVFTWLKVHAMLQYCHVRLSNSE